MDNETCKCDFQLQHDRKTYTGFAGCVVSVVLIMFSFGLSIPATIIPEPVYGWVAVCSIGLLAVLIFTGLWLLLKRENGIIALQVFSAVVILANALLLAVTGTIALVGRAFCSGVLCLLGFFLIFVILIDMKRHKNADFVSLIRRLLVPSCAAVALGYTIGFFTTSAASGHADLITATAMMFIGIVYLALYVTCQPRMSSLQLDDNAVCSNQNRQEENVNKSSRTVLDYYDSLIVESVRSNREDGNKRNSELVELLNENNIESIDDDKYKTRVQELTDKYLLSPRQVEVLQYLIYGRNADWIAKKMFVSTNTVRTHIANIYQKFDVHTVQELLAFFYSN